MQPNALTPKNEVTNKKLLVLFAAFFVPMLVIMLLSPATADDYYFLDCGLTNFQSAVNFVLNYGNGRLLGNICGMYLVYHPVTAAIIKALNITLLSILLPKLFGAKHEATYLLSFLATALTPPQIFAETFTWTSGHFNYIPPIIILILCLLILKSNPSENRLIQFAKIAGVFVLGVCGQLFVEHNTVVNCITAGILFLYFIVKKQPKKRLLSFVFAAASAVGAVAMLLLPSFADESRIQHMNEYRGFALNGSVGEIISFVADNAMYIFQSFTGYTVITLSFSALTLLILINCKKNTKYSKTIRTMCIADLICGSVPTAVCAFLDPTAVYSYNNFLFFIFLLLPTAAVYIMFIVSVFFYNRDNKLRSKCFLSLFVAVFSLMPLLIIHPIGPRTFCFGYIALIAAVVCVFDAVYTSRPKFKYILTSICLAVSVALILVHAIGSQKTKLRSEYIEQQINNNASEIEVYIEMKQYKFETLFGLNHQYYYTVPGDIKFTNIPYDEWRHHRQLEKEQLVEASDRN